MIYPFWEVFFMFLFHLFMWCLFYPCSLTLPHPIFAVEGLNTACGLALNGGALK